MEDEEKDEPDKAVEKEKEFVVCLCLSVSVCMCINAKLLTSLLDTLPRSTSTSYVVWWSVTAGQKMRVPGILSASRKQQKSNKKQKVSQTVISCTPQCRTALVHTCCLDARPGSSTSDRGPSALGKKGKGGKGWTKAKGVGQTNAKPVMVSMFLVLNYQCVSL